MMGGGDMQAVFARSTLLAFDTRFFSASGPSSPGQPAQGGCSLPSPWEGKESNCWRLKAFMPTTRRAMVGVALPVPASIFMAFFSALPAFEEDFSAVLAPALLALRAF